MKVKIGEVVCIVFVCVYGKWEGEWFVQQNNKIGRGRAGKHTGPLLEE